MADRIFSDANNPHTETIEISLDQDDRALLRQLTRDHVFGRDDRVARVLAYLDNLRSAPSRLSPLGARMANGQPHLSCSAAHFQDRRSRGPSMQAAHYLPGQLLVGGAYPWELINEEFPAAQDHLLAAFEMTHNLPVAFNRADSQAEAGGRSTHKRVQYRVSGGRGTIQLWIPEVVDFTEEHQARLTEIFRTCCESVFDDAADATVSNAFKKWLTASATAFRSAVGLKADKYIAAHDAGKPEIKARRALEGVILSIAGSLEPSRESRAHSRINEIQEEVQGILWPGGDESSA